METHNSRPALGGLYDEIQEDASELLLCIKSAAREQVTDLYKFHKQLLRLEDIRAELNMPSN